MKDYENISVQKLSSSMQESRYLLSCNGLYYEVSYPIVELLKALQDSLTIEDAVLSYVEKTKKKYTYKQVLYIITKVINPLLSKKIRDKKTFIYEKKIFSTSSIDKFSNTFKFLFNKVYMAVVFFIALVLNTYFYLMTDDLFQFNNKGNIYMVAGLIVFMLLSSFFHELGHASACKYYGVRHGGIGFGLYLNFPVLYTDVTEVWKLSRLKRCVVNIAGVYFQTFCLIGLLIVFFLTDNDILRYLIQAMNLGFLMTLNPFFKFDGYWIVSDLLGVPNLRSRSNELIDYWYKYIRKRPTTKRPYLLQIRSIEKYGLLVYSIMVNLFMVFYFFYIIPNFFYGFILSFPSEVSELIFYLSNYLTPPFALLRNIGMQLLFLVLIGYFFMNLIRPFTKKYVKK